MKFHGIEMVGPLTLEILETIPAWSPQWKGRIIYVEADDTLYYGKGAFWQAIAVGSETVSISDEPYDSVTWNNSLDGASKNALRDKFESVQDILDLLAPTPPPNLSTLSLAITSLSYEARRAIGTNMGSVIAGALCTYVIHPVTAESSNDFYDGDSGTLTALVNDSSIGSKELTSSDDSGTYGDMSIDSDVDYYAGEGAPKEGFYSVLMASIVSYTPPLLGENVYKISHSVTGEADVTLIYDSSPVVPSVSALSPIFSSPTTRWLSGVPSVSAGDTVLVDVSASNIVGECYHKDHPVQITSPYISSSVDVTFVSPPAKGAALVKSGVAVLIGNNVYTETFYVDATAYTPTGSNFTPLATVLNSRIDTVSPVETTVRVKSGSGQYPSSGYGATYDSTESLAVNKEAQLINGKFQYPDAVDYSSNSPTAGPNYTSIPSGDVIGLGVFRWFTQLIRSDDGTGMRSVTFSINNSSEFGDILDSDVLIYIKVEGATGWLDANAAYPGVGSPTSDGDPCLDVANSTATLRRATFGPTTRMGDVYVRIGLKRSTSKKFSSVTLSEIT